MYNKRLYRYADLELPNRRVQQKENLGTNCDVNHGRFNPSKKLKFAITVPKSNQESLFI